MPVIEYNSGGETFELSTAPPDGFIKARALNYDEMLTRRDLAAKTIFREKQREATGKPSSNGIGAQREKAPSAEELEVMMESANRAVQTFQFSTQIIDHNLELPGGVRFNFANPTHLKKLPAKVGAEIEGILDELNEGDNTDEGDFPDQSSTSSAVTAESATPAP